MKEILVSFIVCLLVSSMIHGCTDTGAGSAENGQTPMASADGAAEPGSQVPGDGTSAGPALSSGAALAGKDVSVEPVTDSSFPQTVLSAQEPVLVDFYGSYCGPCKIMAPIVDEVAQTMSNKLKVVKLDVQANPQTRAKYNITGIPTFIVFKNGQAVESTTGTMPKEELVAMLKKHIN
jgi:thioredoxin 1